MKKILFANYLALLFACELPNVENSSAKLIEGEVIMENFDSNNLLNDDRKFILHESLKLINNTYANFKGYLSLQNNGGFSSIRAYYPPDLTNVKSIVLKVRGDGRKYNFRIRGNTESWASYTHSFDTVEGEWNEIELKIDDFYPVYRGYTLKNMPQLSEVIIKEIGIMLSDKIEGSFSIDIDWIMAK